MGMGIMGWKCKVGTGITNGKSLIKDIISINRLYFTA